jgi:proteasome lid subunit RPN8/RPN11
MRDIEVPEELVQEIRAHARETFPEECCGILLVPTPEGERGPRRVLAVRRAQNGSTDERARRFVIPPEELRGVERQLEGTGQMVGGFYHSHPNHPALPSEFDRDHAWPWYSYLILGVTPEAEGPLGSFELDEESGSFVATRLTSLPTSRWPDSKRTPKNPGGEEGVP